MTDAERECREAFEAWWSDAHPGKFLWLERNGEYGYRHQHEAWLAYQAAWNARHPRADAEDRVVVERVARAIMMTDDGHIQGFLYEPYHVIRDVSKAPSEQELHRTIFEGEYREMLDLERAKVIARAALKALGGEG